MQDEDLRHLVSAQATSHREGKTDLGNSSDKEILSGERVRSRDQVIT